MGGCTRRTAQSWRMTPAAELPGRRTTQNGAATAQGEGGPAAQRTADSARRQHAQQLTTAEGPPVEVERTAHGTAAQFESSGIGSRGSASAHGHGSAEMTRMAGHGDAQERNRRVAAQKRTRWRKRGEARRQQTVRHGERQLSSESERQLSSETAGGLSMESRTRNWRWSQWQQRPKGAGAHERESASGHRARLLERQGHGLTRAAIGARIAENAEKARRREAWHGRWVVKCAGAVSGRTAAGA